MAIVDNLIGYFADFVLANIGDLGYSLLLWFINILLGFQVVA